MFNDMPSLPPCEAANHWALIIKPYEPVNHTSHVVESVVTERDRPMCWAPPVYFMAMSSATGRTVYIPAPEPIRFPIPAEGELAKAVAQIRAAKAAASEQSRSENLWAR